MADKVKEVAIEEADRIKSLTVEAARSAAYLYPLRVSMLLNNVINPTWLRTLLYGTAELTRLVGYRIFCVPS